MSPRVGLLTRLAMRWLMNADDRRAALTELTELHAHRAARDGPAAADAWLRRQSAQYAWRLLLHPEPVRTMLNDLRHSLRSLSRTPVLAGTIILTVGLGIGATTAIFGIVDAVLLRPLPYAEPGQLVRLYTDAPPNQWRWSVADWRAFEQRHDQFSQIAAFTTNTATFSSGDLAPERVSGRFVTWQFFPLLGIRPMLGRDFTTADSALAAPRTVILGHRFWRNRLGADSGIVGQSIRLDGTDYQVIGVLPETRGTMEAQRDFFAAAQWPAPRRRGPFFVTALARLKGSATAADAELEALSRALFPVWQASYQDERATFRTMPMKSWIVRDTGRTVLIVMGAMFFVLLIATTNAANLLVARATRRGRELAVRQALGATRGRLLQHLLSESAILAAGSAAVGALLANSGLKLMRAAGSSFVPRTAEMVFTPTVIVVFVALVLASAALFGLVPSLGVIRGRLDETLRAASRSATPSSATRTARRALVMTQFAVATPLLIAAGLLIGSLAKLQRVDPGFDPSNLLTGTVRITQAQYPDTSDVRVFFDRATARFAAIPGVRSVAWSNSLPPNNAGDINNFDLEDRPAPAGGAQPVAPFVRVTNEYFATMGITLKQGRLFEPRDFVLDTTVGPVVVVDEAWARRFFPGSAVLGRRFRSGGCSTCLWTTVVGLVNTVKYTGLDGEELGAVYTPLVPYEAWRSLVLRTEADPLTVLPPVRAAVRELDPSLAFPDVATGEQLIATSLQTERYLSVLVGSFAALALLLSVVGIYGVMSYFVQEHTRDIGVRIALGGTAGRVVQLVVGQGMRVVAIGVLAGVLGAFALTRFMQRLLFDVGAADPLTFALVAALMLTVAFVACLLPARRAAKLDPVATLRDD